MLVEPAIFEYTRARAVRTQWLGDANEILCHRVDSAVPDQHETTAVGGWSALLIGYEITNRRRAEAITPPRI